MRVELNDVEMATGSFWGVQRRLSARAKGRKGAHGFNRDDFWQLDIEGVLAEMAVAKALGVYYVPVVGHLDTEDGDVLPGVQVRSTKYPTGHLLIHESDFDDHRFVLVCGGDGNYSIPGWMYARDAKQKKWWKSHRGRSAFWVPQNALRVFSPRNIRRAA